MKQEIRDLIETAINMFVRTTGLKAVHRSNPLNEKKYPEGLVSIDHQDMQWRFAVQAKTRVTHTVVAMEKYDQRDMQEARIVITRYVTPRIADRMKKNELFFMDTVGNVYINKPPLYVFIKGNKQPEEVKTAPAKRLWKPGGLKVVFALLSNPDMTVRPYREIAAMTGVALGTVDWIFRDLREMGYLLEMGGRKRRLMGVLTLLKRWVEAYPEQLRPKLVIDRFEADTPQWWKNIDILDYNACWGGEVAAAKLTGRLKPERVAIYADELPGKWIIENKLRKAADGDIEILKPFWNFAHALTHRGIAPPLLVYADLMATGDDRNIETAGIIYDQYLVQPVR